MWSRIIITFIVFSGSYQQIYSQDLIFSSEESDSAEDSLMVIGLRENTTDGFKTITEYSAVNCPNDDFKTKSELNMYTNNIDIKEALKKHEKKKTGCGISKEKSESFEWDDYKTKPLVTLVTEGAVQQPPFKEDPIHPLPLPTRPPAIITEPIQSPMTCFSAPPVQPVQSRFGDDNEEDLDTLEDEDQHKDIQKMSETSQSSLENIENENNDLSQESEHNGLKIGSGVVTNLSEPQKIEMTYVGQKMNISDNNLIIQNTADVNFNSTNNEDDVKSEGSRTGNFGYSQSSDNVDSNEHPDTNWRLDESSLPLTLNDQQENSSLDETALSKDNIKDDVMSPLQVDVFEDHIAHEVSYEHPDTNWRLEEDAHSLDLNMKSTENINLELDESATNKETADDHEVSPLIAPRFNMPGYAESYEHPDTNWRLDESSLNKQKAQKIKPLISPRFNDWDSYEIYEDLMDGSLEYITEEPRIYQPMSEYDINTQIEAPPPMDSLDTIKSLDYSYLDYKYKEHSSMMPRFEDYKNSYEDYYHDTYEYYIEYDYDNNQKEVHQPLKDKNIKSQKPQRPESPIIKSSDEDVTDLFSKAIQKKIDEKTLKTSSPTEEKKNVEIPTHSPKLNEDNFQHMGEPRTIESNFNTHKGMRPAPPEKQGPKKKFGEVKFNLNTPLKV